MPSARSGTPLPRQARDPDKLAASLVAVDACFALKLLLPEEYSEHVRRIWESWVKNGTEIFAPYLLAYEVVSVLRNKVSREELSPEEGEAALLAMNGQGIHLLHPEGLDQMAWDLARELNRPTAYDTSYLALSRILDCVCWTADARLKNAASGKIHNLRWVGELAL